MKSERERAKEREKEERGEEYETRRAFLFSERDRG